MVIYLHGFASSSLSGKATYLGQRLRARGVKYAAPDLNLPDFSMLTITRMLEQTRALIASEPEPVTLIGSSLGAFVAVNAAAKWPDKSRRWCCWRRRWILRDLGGAELQAWRESGQMNVFHFGYGRMMQVGYALYEDARRYDAINADLRMPVLVFQGKHDTAVDPATVQAWSAARPNVTLHLLDDDHQLGASLDYMWQQLETFLGLP